ncbi:hypothetical protein KHA80_19225 [Anaerobacillus sp. HL2]|nr:hypothetical protein KHA80_19225 [Anaerobacillus sp. HL2]
MGVTGSNGKTTVKDLFEKQFNTTSYKTHKTDEISTIILDFH